MAGAVALAFVFVKGVRMAKKVGQKGGAPKLGSADELAALFPGARTLIVDCLHFEGAKIEMRKEEVVVWPLILEQFGAIQEALGPLTVAAQDMAGLHALVREHHKEVAVAVAIAIRWPAEKVARIPLDQLWAVAELVLLTNENFIVRLLGLAVSERLATVEALARGDGSTPSATSKSADTPPPSATH